MEKEHKYKGLSLIDKNAKEIYLKSFCAAHLVYPDQIDFIKGYSDETCLKWNAEYINMRLDEFYELFSKEDSILTIEEQCGAICLIYHNYTTDYNTYRRYIDYLKLFYKRYGYFMNYGMKYHPKYNYQHTFDEFKRYYFSKTSKKIIEYEISTANKGCIYWYYPEEDYEGLIPSLYYAKHYDLLDEYLTDILLPMCRHFLEDSRYMKENNLEYFKNYYLQEERRSIPLTIKRTRIAEAIEYLKGKDYPIPKELDDYLDI